MRVIFIILCLFFLSNGYCDESANLAELNSKLLSKNAFGKDGIYFEVKIKNVSDKNLCIIGWPIVARSSYILNELHTKRYVIENYKDVTYLGVQGSRLDEENHRVTILPPSSELKYSENIMDSYKFNKDGEYKIIFYSMYFDCGYLSNPDLSVALLSNSLTRFAAGDYYHGKGFDWFLKGRDANKKNILSKVNLAVSHAKFTVPLIGEKSE
ncbi:hypothetical protein L9G74_00050 [Shewanella sp. C32]|uniref:Uncharacterized protein n=1 Tax=Shewanella electrica TaxID=515560 RepID=A0ABT2FEY0_9GAMM|nr:hypothetical protein [Shewanella electrica]MCH1925001.1 hypothetical protein [Shewanella electrica]MCS4554825.1 hypothetical protein [Shewanella electrica]